MMREETVREKSRRPLMSSILIQYTTASPDFGGTFETFSKARKSFFKGGSASTAAATSGDATFPIPAGYSRRDFFRGEGEPEQERLAMMMKSSDRISNQLPLYSECYQYQLSYDVIAFDVMPLPHVIFAIDADRAGTEHGSILGDRLDRLEWNRDVVVSIMGLPYNLAIRSFSSRSTEGDNHHRKSSPLV